MNIRPIRTEDDLTWALGEVEAYFQSEPQKGTEESDRFEILLGLIQGYEAQHWAIDPLTEEEHAADLAIRVRARALAARQSRLNRLMKAYGTQRTIRYFGPRRSKRPALKVG